MKKILTMLLCVCFIIGLVVPTAFAAGAGATVYTVTPSDPSPMEVEINHSFTFDVYISGTYDEYMITFPSGTYYTVNTISAISGVTVTGNEITAAGLGVVDGARTYIATVNCTASNVIGAGINLEVGGLVSSSFSTIVTFSKGTVNFSCSHGSESATVTTQPTCTTDGEKTHTCTICGYTWTSLVAASGHTWSVWTDIGTQHKHTCTKCTITEQGDHTWENGVVKYPANCVSGATMEYDCAICGLKPTRVEGSPTDHSYAGGKAEMVNDATHKLVCDGCGVANGAIVAHTFDDTSYTNNGANHIKRCTAVGCTFEVEDSHIWVAGDIVSEATCSQKAKREWTCVCGAFENREEGETTSHTYNNGETEMVDDATHRLVCDGCGVANGAIVAHTFDDTSYVNNGANHVKKCTADGCTFEVAESHNWVAGDIVSTATCNQKAKREWTCICGASENREEGETASHIYAGGIYYTVNETTHQQVCDACGVNNGAVSDHTFICTDLGNGSHKKECSGCGFVAGSESHNCDWNGGEVTEAATCISKAKKKYTCEFCNAQWEDVDEAGEFGAHNFGAPTQVDSAKHKQTCSVCGLIETVAHAFPPSWLPNGDGLLHYRSCACGATEYVPHTWDTGELVIAPTDESVGLRKYVCTGCGAVTEETVPMTDHEHSYSDEWYSDGSNHWKACACGDKVEITPHTFDNGRVEVAPTCKVVGKKIVTCTVCGEKKTEDIPLVDHSFAESTVTKEPTCTTAGEKTGVCSTCGATETAGIPALGHTAGEFEVTEEATCKQVGKKVQKCTVCGAVVKEEAVPMKEHTYGDWIEDDGVLKRICTECGAVDSKVDKVYTPSLVNEEHGFTIYALEGKGFIDGWRLIVQEITSGLSDSERTSLVTSAKVLNKNYFVANTFNIWLEDMNGNPVEYSGKMRVEFPKPQESEESEFIVVGYTMAFADENSVLALRETEIKSVDATEKINFKTEGLGRFCLLGEQPETEQSKGMDTWLIVLIATIAVLVPVGAFVIIFMGRRKKDEDEEL